MSGGDAAVRPPGDAGFTLIEVLAAVAIAGFLISAIGSIVAVTFAGVRSAADRVALAETGRTLLASLPQGDALKLGTTSGAMGTTRWRIDVTPLREPPSAARPTTAGAPPVQWGAASVSIAARAASGRSLRLQTVGLIRRAAPP